jgi:hypothetical protein
MANTTQFPGRPIDHILADWRAAEAAQPTDGTAPDVELLERIGYLRDEYEAAVAERAEKADELRRMPRFDSGVGHAV